MLLRLLLVRLLLPLLVLTLLAVGLTGYTVGRDLGVRQLQLARSVAHTIDDYLEHAGRVMGAVAQVAETATPEELASYMQATWQAYGYFDTLYQLDERGIITLLAPPDPRYQGLDMSHQPYFQQARAQTGAMIFQPFTSLHTEQPAVYVAWPLADGGMVVGQLNLGALQEAITYGREESDQYIIFVADRSGTLVAHPQPDLVAQQANVGHLEIVRRGLADEATMFYPADGTFVLGGTTQVEHTGWVVVVQTPWQVVYGPYLGAAGLALVLVPIVWLAMILNFRQQLSSHVVAPLARLSQGADALAAGDFAQGAALAAIPAAFAEVGALAADFERMSQAIQSRQATLQASEERLRRKTHQQEQFLETARHLTESLDSKQVLTRIGMEAKEILEAHGCAIYLLEPDGRTLTPVVAIEPPHEEAILSTPIDVETSFTGQAVKARRGLVFNDAPVNVSGQQIPGTPIEEEERIIAAPFVVDDRVLGAMCLSRIGKFFSDEDLALAETFATYAATALKNAQAHDELQREIKERKRAEEEIRQRTAQLEALRQVGLELTAQLDLDTLLHSIVSRAAELLRGTGGGIDIYRPERDILEYSVSIGLDSVPSTAVLRRGEGLSGKVLETGEPLIVDDYQHWEGRAAVWEGYPITAILGVPVRWGDEFLGVLQVRADPPRTFSPADAELLSLFATQAAIAIRNARLFEAEQEQRELAEALEEAAAAVSSTLDPDQVLDRILEQVERVVAGDTFNVMLLEDGTARIVRWRGYERIGVELRGAPFPVARYPSLVKMVQIGKPVVIPDTAADPDWIPLESQEWRRSYVGAPVRVRDMVVGFLNVNSTRPGQFGPADGRRLEAFAAHAATAIENAQLYRELLDHAEQLEQRVRERTTQLQAQYARLDAILRSTSDGIVVADAEGEIVQTNPVAQAWLAQTLSPQDAARLRETLRYMTRQAGTGAADGERPEMMLELTGLDLELKAAPISEPGLEKAAAVVAVHDVSHLKALDRMKNRFVTNISHELRTPVTTIKLYAYLMQQQPEKWREYLKPLAQEVDHQVQLVGDILQISHIDAGRLEMKPRPTSLDELTQAAVASRQVLAQERGLTLEYRPETGFFGKNPVSLVDPERLKQVLNNLVENSIYYTPEGGKVVVSTGKEEAKGRVWATVTVADTGIGIPAEELPYIFDRFFRGVEPRSMQISGTGLGLAIVREIVELHGGRVTVESQVDAGTTFTVWLPLADAQG